MRTRPILVVAAAAAAALAGWFVLGRGSSSTLPAPGTATYDSAARAFYHGLAALEVGLLDDARAQFTRAAQTVPAEPAAWANLGLTELRRGEADAAAAPVERALALAPNDSDLLLLAARMEASRGRVDESVSLLRRAVAADATGLRARFALAEEVERSGQPNADAEAQALLDELTGRAPESLALQLERARLSAKRGDVAGLRSIVVMLAGLAEGWPAPAQEQYRALRVAADSGVRADTVRATVLLRNVLARVPAFSDSLADLRTPAELIAEPLPGFRALAQAPATPSPRDAMLTFTPEPLAAEPGITSVAVMWTANGEPRIFGADATMLRRLDGTGTWSLPVGAAVPAPSGGNVPAAGNATSPNGGMPALLAVDWNHDFVADAIGAGPAGLRLLLQDAGGRFMDATPPAGADALCPCSGVWAADVEMDGDVDLVVATPGATRVLRNNGDGTWQAMPTFDGASGARAFAWGDLDRDADPDAAFVDGAGALRVAINRQGGAFSWLAPVAPSAGGRFVALTIADLDADGTNDAIVLDAAGQISRATWTAGQVELRAFAVWEGFVAGAVESGASARLLAADLDNNGALDLLASTAQGARVWLVDEGGVPRALETAIPADVFAVADLDRDGRLDLVGMSAGRPMRLRNGGALDYHWKELRPRAQQNAGDQRINSFGLGGEIEVRAGLLWQRQIVTAPVVHFGLGSRTAIDVARVLWPNGVPQAEFAIGVDDAIVAEQRLKGSCPWVFADDGTGPKFVTDFLWRSPLGLRINAQVTAGVTQTEDWIKIRGEQLVARGGTYDVRITAELWETHFFDHVALAVVDHPAEAEVFVDERFAATRPQVRRVIALEPPRAVAAAWDDTGRDVTDVIVARDGRYLATFARGPYQGIAREHAVEIDLGPPVDRPAGAQLVAVGWVYPTDSSINLAMSQGTRARASGMALEAQDTQGRWRVVAADLGFPAGKNKTMLIDLSGVGESRRVRLRTNLEVYWDWLALAAPSAAPVRIARQPLAGADLRYRGFSRTSSPRGDAPETPDYADLANTTQRWRDLAGYYTRFGAVPALLTRVDDRYVIMNAGDELRLRFAAPAAPPAGWVRDFVLMGDGWEKDGDYNTSHSQTVLPLPAHAVPGYGETPGPVELENDPVYRRYPEDWARYHTRYVTPARFVNGLRPPSPRSAASRRSDARKTGNN